MVLPRPGEQLDRQSQTKTPLTLSKNRKAYLNGCTAPTLLR